MALLNLRTRLLERGGGDVAHLKGGIVVGDRRKLFLRKRLLAHKGFLGKDKRRLALHHVRLIRMQLRKCALVLGIIHLRVDKCHNLAVRDMGVEVDKQLDDASVDLRTDLHFLDWGDGACRLDCLHYIRLRDRSKPELRSLLLRKLLGATRKRRKCGSKCNVYGMFSAHYLCSFTI